MSVAITDVTTTISEVIIRDKRTVVCPSVSSAKVVVIMAGSERGFSREYSHRDQDIRSFFLGEQQQWPLTYHECIKTLTNFL